MRRTHLHLLTDAVMAIAFLSLLATGLLIAFVLPAGSRDAAVWSLTRHDWGDLHFWIAMVMLAAIAVHLLLNWRWLCTSIAQTLPGHKRFNRHTQLALGLATLLTILLLIAAFFTAAWFSKAPAHQGNHPTRQRLNLNQH